MARTRSPQKVVAVSPTSCDKKKPGRKAGKDMAHRPGAITARRSSRITREAPIEAARTLAAMSSTITVFAQDWNIQEQKTYSPPKNKTGAKRKRVRPHIMSKDDRRELLEKEEWLSPESIRPKMVECQACEKDIKLDYRGEYYPGFWRRHKVRCLEIRYAELVKEGFTAEEAGTIVQREQKRRPVRIASGRRRTMQVRPTLKKAKQNLLMNMSSTQDPSDSIAQHGQGLEAAPVSLVVRRTKELHLNPV